VAAIVRAPVIAEKSTAGFHTCCDSTAQARDKNPRERQREPCEEGVIKREAGSSLRNGIRPAWRSTITGMHHATQSYGAEKCLRNERYGLWDARKGWTGCRPSLSRLVASTRSGPACIAQRFGRRSDGRRMSATRAIDRNSKSGDRIQ